MRYWRLESLIIGITRNRATTQLLLAADGLVVRDTPVFSLSRPAG